MFDNIADAEDALRFWRVFVLFMLLSRYFLLNKWENARIALNNVLFPCQTFAGSLGRGQNTRPSALCTNTFLEIKRMFVH